MIFTYLDVFGTDKEAIEEMKAYYRRGGLGDVKIKQYLADVLEAEFAPICTRREELEKDPSAVMEILRKGSEEVAKVAAQTLFEIKLAMGINYFH